jgi:hypothetical protein
MIPPNAISQRFVHPDFAVSSPYAAKWIPHEQERKGPSASHMIGLRQQNDLTDPHKSLTIFRQGGDISSLMGAFDAVRSVHAAMPADAYNKDHVYKENLNQVRASVLSRGCARSSHPKFQCNSTMHSVARIYWTGQRWNHFSCE